MFRSRSFRFALILILVAATSEASAGGRRCRKQCCAPRPTCVLPCGPVVRETQQFWTCWGLSRCQMSLGYLYYMSSASHPDQATAQNLADEKTFQACEGSCPNPCDQLVASQPCTQMLRTVARYVDQTQPIKGYIIYYECKVTLICREGHRIVVTAEGQTAKEACALGKQIGCGFAAQQGFTVCRILYCPKKICILLK